MRLWCLLHRRPAKAQASLRIRAVSPEPLLFAHIWKLTKGIEPHWIAAHACSKNEFTEDEECHYLMSWLIQIIAKSILYGTEMLRLTGQHVGDNCFIRQVALKTIHMTVQGKKISNDQELIKSDPISCPQNQKGNN